ncbi:MAG: hypothetical protein A2309_02890 [Bacteroidetes bacterium RIFOXYB2_FULL_35_7]|nr:MAG: hypothetical protein A2309_02890 [Bacteroidetes bacterium RIFOXYB2_FULL_35_7]
MTYPPKVKEIELEWREHDCKKINRTCNNCDQLFCEKNIKYKKILDVAKKPTSTVDDLWDIMFKDNKGGEK